MDERKKEIVAYCFSREQIIDMHAIELLEHEEHWKQILDQIEGSFISEDRVRAKLVRHESKLGNLKEEVVVARSTFKALAREESSDCRVLEEYEVTGKSSSEGKIANFLEYFRDKYLFLNGLLSHRIGFAPKTFDKIKGLAKYDLVDLVGMVVKKWVSKNGNVTIELDSPEGSCIAIVSKDDIEANREAQKILVDDVIGIKAKKFTDEMVIAKSFVWPELMQKPLKLARRDLSVALISDIHAGSKLFLEKEFMRFMSWLNCNSEDISEKERAGKIKYLVIAGDNVDGVGIYPEQYDELAIKDIFAQYEKLADLLEQIPEYIEVFMCPGQHDAVRRADPQPAIPREYVKRISAMKNIHLVGSPSWIEFEGMKSLIYHGASFHDMIAATCHLNYKEPEKCMIELLKRRDLSTGFGLGNPYVPEKRDYMVIREEPDFYFGGDIHIKGYSQYRGCMAINAGCWQARTDYQIREGLHPTPGICIDVNLKTRKLNENNFMGADAQ